MSGPNSMRDVGSAVALVLADGLAHIAPLDRTALLATVATAAATASKLTPPGRSHPVTPFPWAGLGLALSPT
jgi:hypothetical protein